MSNDLDILERLRSDPAPPMHLDLDRVVARGRQRVRRRVAGLAAAACAAAAAVVAVGSTVLSTDDHRSTTPPVGTTASTATAAPAGDLSLTGNGRTQIPGKGGSYAVWVDDGTIRTQVAPTGERPSTTVPSSLVLPSGASWLVVQGAQGSPVLVGVVPAGATDIDIVPAGTLPPHTVTTAPAGDFEAFVVEFAAPPDPMPIAADLTWRASGTSHRALSGSPGEVAFEVAGVGRLKVTLSGDQLGAGIAAAELDGAALPTQPVMGDTPGSSWALGKHALPDGRVLVWGVVPQQTLGVRLHLEPGASAGATATRPLGDHPTYLAYAVVVTGSVQDVTGMQTTDRSGTGINFIN